MPGADEGQPPLHYWPARQALSRVTALEHPRTIGQLAGRRQGHLHIISANYAEYRRLVPTKQLEQTARERGCLFDPTATIAEG
jgi:hypothetical protein